MTGEQILIDEGLRKRWASQPEPIEVASSSITNPASWDAGSMSFDLPAGHVVCGIVVEPSDAPNTSGRRFVIKRIDYCRDPSEH
jgi:hypothetical protein